MRRRDGTVLILALWSLFFLAALALAVGGHVSANLKLADAFQRSARTALVARAGVALAAARAARNTNAWDGMVSGSWTLDETAFRAWPVGEGSVSVWCVGAGPDGASVTNWGVIGEECRIDLNRADPALLRGVFRAAGGLDDEAAREAVAALTGYRREKLVGLLTGGQPSRYDPQAPGSGEGAEIESVAELYLVDGMRAETVDAIVPLVTVHGAGGRVNINAASAAVLTCVAEATRRGEPGQACRALADAIVAWRRAGNAFASDRPSDIMDAMREAGATDEQLQVLSKMTRFLTTRSSCFGGVAQADAAPAGDGLFGEEGAAGSGGGARIRFVVAADGGEVLHWHEQ